MIGATIGAGVGYCISPGYLTSMTPHYMTRLRTYIIEIELTFLKKSGGKRKKLCTVVKEQQLYIDKASIPQKDTRIVFSCFKGYYTNMSRLRALLSFSAVMSFL
jgi:hypothetical protein